MNEWNEYDVIMCLREMYC